MVIDEPSPAVEFDGWIAMSDLEVKKMSLLLCGDALGHIEKFGGYSLPAVAGMNEQLIDPSAFAAVFETVVETNDKVADRLFGNSGEISQAIAGVA